MIKEKFLVLMNFPIEWSELEMYPDELYEIQEREYVPGHEESSEHTRNGAFHWWLHRSPTKEVLVKLAVLAKSDPDPLLFSDVRAYILRSPKCDAEVEQMLNS